MEVDSAGPRAAIERDLSCYADHWRHLQEEEVEAPYGPIDPELADIEELRRKGTCIHAVILRAGVDGIEATWAGDSGQNIEEGAAVVISREHPKVDRLRTFTVATRNPGRLELRPGLSDVDLDKHKWRLDLEVKYVPFYRVATAISHFTSLPPTSPPSPLQVVWELLGQLAAEEGIQPGHGYSGTSSGYGCTCVSKWFSKKCSTTGAGTAGASDSRPTWHRQNTSG